VSVGGRKSLLGAVAATIAVEYLRLSLGGEFALVAVGALLLLSILFLPGGVVPWVDGKIARSRLVASDGDSPGGPAEVSDS